MGIYWHCPDCEATAPYPARTIAASVSGLRRHQTVFDHHSELTWHRRPRLHFGDGKYEYVLMRGGTTEVGHVYSRNGEWFGRVAAEILGSQSSDFSCNTKREAQDEVERYAHKTICVAI